MNLVIDWGNSSLKAGWFDGERLISIEHIAGLPGLRDRLKVQHPERVIVSSTSHPAETLREHFSDLLLTDWFVLNADLAVPIKKDYDTPHTLGADRVAAAVVATVLFPDANCLVIDMGTCITADVIDQSGTFRGGLISPGLRMRLLAMHQFTARLPLVEVNDLTGSDWPSLTAKNTRQAMQSGALNGMLLELAGIIEKHRQQYTNLRVLVCGGDAPIFESNLKPPIFAVPELVLRGLNRILEYNVKELRAN